MTRVVYPAPQCTAPRSKLPPWRLDRLELIELWIKVAWVDQRSSILKEMRIIADENEHGNLSAELSRLKGQLLLIHKDSNFAEAESCFRRSIKIARKQSTKSIELRATTSLARLLASRGRRDEARTTLANIYGWPQIQIRETGGHGYVSKTPGRSCVKAFP